MTRTAPRLAPRHWVPAPAENRVQTIARETAQTGSAALDDRIEALIQRNQQIHERDCFNLNPATNVMNPRAEAALSRGLGSRPSLGYPGDKYEMGLQAIEEIEVIAAELAAEIFDATHAEIRVPSGALANLYGFIALAKPGDAIIAPPATIGGHVTHHADGCAGLYGLVTHPAPVDADGYSVDLDALRDLALRVRPKVITVGGSLNLFEHPVAGVRAIADEVGAHVLFDAAHQCGIIAGKAWSNPLDHGAHLMTMSTYKSLGGPAGGLIVTRDAKIAERLDHIAFPGMTANFDAAKSAALAIGLLDWRDHGRAYAQTMIDTAQAFAKALSQAGLPVFAEARGFTRSHQFAVAAAEFGGGQAASRKLEQAGFLACGIGLPLADVPGDMNGLRIGTPELVRWGVTPADIPEIAALVAEALRANDPAAIAPRTAALRARFDRLHFIRD
ncbi:aminotransferase class I/II-fold pyridoxal phosphate-dependent enzyme [Rhodobacter sp. NTK016B]|uniref:serine hydroxymethyltransferase n=1 Tax=Rhodobacter sp. NTK016B TaxID=2759676 RepID=UPI001A8CD0A6|nr:aminotransferase class I/II-fold pyridoxal phosphate-dependent enzyme [Rhodobacter sp. NTK016B]MBN8294507.1 aminotransferase class I/II-fold pyridoxal phosphate-dependent enzyme [Rhodobacter sp. NTK016B]